MRVAGPACQIEQFGTLRAIDAGGGKDRCNVLRLRRPCTGFPTRDGAVRNSELFSQPTDGETRSLTGIAKSCAERACLR